MIQYSASHRQANMTEVVTEAAATAFLLIYSGAAPANAAAAATGTLLASLPCSPTMGTVASGVLTANAITAAAAAAAGIAGYWRLCTSSAGTTVIAQGNVFQTTPLVTSALSLANSNVLNFAAGGAAAVAGMSVSGTGILPGTYVVGASTATTVTLSQASTAGVASGATITFGGDLSLNNTSIAAGQTVSVSSFILTATGA